MTTSIFITVDDGPGEGSRVAAAAAVRVFLDRQAVAAAAAWHASLTGQDAEAFEAFGSER